jgi:hypothetical protein
MRKKYKTTIGVSQLARFVDDEAGFERFIMSKGNSNAIKAGNDFHDKAVYRVKKGAFEALVIIGVILSGVFFTIVNGWFN